MRHLGARVLILAGDNGTVGNHMVGEQVQKGGLALKDSAGKP
jgi:hypothetical protein